MTFSEEPGILGAKRSSWRKPNPRELLWKIIQANEAAGEAIWREMFWNEVEDDKIILQAVVQYWLDLNIRALDPSKKGGRQRPAPAPALTEQIRETIKVKATQTLLLELIMPNDKPLAQCTGAECVTFGGWFQSIASEVPPEKMVAEVLTEQQVRKLWQTSQK